MSEEQWQPLTDAIIGFLSKVSLDDLRQQWTDISYGMDMITLPNLERVFRRHGAMDFPIELLVKRVSTSMKNSNMIPIAETMAYFEQVQREDSREESYLDVLKLMLIQEDNDLLTFSETLRGIIQEEDQEPIRQGFADALANCTEEEIRRFVGDVVSLATERGRLEYLSITVKFIRYFVEYGQEQIMFIERYLVCNPYVAGGVLPDLLMTFSELSPADLLDNLVYQDLQGSSVFGLNRLSSHLWGRVTLEVLQKYLEATVESGKQELSIVIRDMIRTKMTAAARTKRSSSSLTTAEEAATAEEESRVLVEYAHLTELDRDSSSSGSRVTMSELERYFGGMMDVSQLDPEVMHTRNIRSLLAWSFIENSETLRRIHGPVNAPGIDTLVDEDGTRVELPDEPRLFHMRFNDVAYRLKQGDVDEELLEDPHLCFIRDWFTGFCQFSQEVILDRQTAVRKPRLRGGWYGCYSDPGHIFLEMMQSYDVPVEHRHAVLENLEEQFIRFFREVLGLEDNQLGFAFLTKNHVLLTSEDSRVQTPHDLDSPLTRMPKIVIRYALEHDEPSRESMDYGGGDLQDFANSLLEGILSSGGRGGGRQTPQQARELLRSGGPARKFEKEIILKREDIIIFALTKIYFS